MKGLFYSVIFKWLIILSTIFILNGCYFNKKNRAFRKIEKAKVLYPSYFKNDTIKIIDTVVVDNYVYDTITQIKYNDTVIVINNEKVSLKYYYDTLRKEIYHDVICKGDTLIIEREKIIDRLSKKYKFMEYKEYFKDFILLLILLLTIYLIIRRNIK